MEQVQVDRFPTIPIWYFFILTFVDICLKKIKICENALTSEIYPKMYNVSKNAK